MSEDKAIKFVRTDEISSLFDSLIRQEDRENCHNFYVSVFDPSHLTECPRRIIYRAQGCNPESFSYLNTMGELFARKKWLEYLGKCKSIKVVDKNIVAADCHYNISGNVDAVLNIGDCNYVAKIQPVNNSDFKQIEEKGAIKKHVVELIVYMWLTELRDGLLLYENQNTYKYTVFHVKPYAPVIKSVIKKCSGLMESKIQGVIPVRPYKTKDANECKVCEFSKKCWR